MLPTVEESLVSLFDSASFLDSLPFQATKGRIADTALAPAEVFEGTYVRDAEEHELGLFSTEDSSSHDGLYAAGAGSSSSIDHHSVRERDDRARHRRSLLGRSTGRSSTSRSGGHLGSSASTSHNAWHFPKSRGPARIGAPEKATPLKKRRAQPAQNNNVVDPEAYLLAARKLLQTYPMQRASEHVELLYSQYEGLMDAIADLEETLHQAPKASTSAATIEDSKEDDIASLEADIKREELEILALKEVRKELDREAKEAAGAKSSSSSSSIAGRQAPRTTSTRPPPPAVKMPSLKIADRPTKPAAKTVSSSSAATTIGGKRVPSIVARRMAEQKEAAANARSPKGSSPASSVSATPKASLAPSVPELNVQSPSNTSMANHEEEGDEDQTIVLGGRPTLSDAKDEVPTSEPEVVAPPRPQLNPRIPSEQFEKILAKIISALPGSTRKNTSKDAEAVLSALKSTISQAEAGITSPSSSVSGASITASPTSSPLTAVNIIEFHLLYTFLSLLVSLELEASTNSKDKLNLILRKPVSNSITGTPDARTNDNARAVEAFLNMNNLKIYLGGKAKEKGMNEDLGHKAIYGLVAKRILKIDRKGREALVCFT